MGQERIFFWTSNALLYYCTMSIYSVVQWLYDSNRNNILLYMVFIFLSDSYFTLRTRLPMNSTYYNSIVESIWNFKLTRQRHCVHFDFFVHIQSGFLLIHFFLAFKKIKTFTPIFFFQTEVNL